MKYPIIFSIIIIHLFFAPYGKAQQWVEKLYTYDSIMDQIYGTATNFYSGTDTLKMDIYTPVCEGTAGISKRPLLVFIHGGAFLTGGKDDASITKLARQFARRGYVTASITYRLGMINDDTGRSCNIPDYSCIFATDSAEWYRALYRGIQDTKGAIRFLVNRNEQYKIDPNHIFVAGESAGAFLALGAALLDTISEKFPAAYAIEDAPFPHSSAMDCAHNKKLPQNSGPLPRPDLGSIEGDIEPTNIPYTIKGVGNIYGAMTSDLLMHAPVGKHKPIIYQFHQPCDLVVPFQTAKIFFGLSWCLTNGYGCYGIANTPTVFGSQAISNLNSQNNYGYTFLNDFTTTTFPYSFLFGNASCLSQVDKPCHAYDNPSLRENNMASFFAEAISIESICQLTGLSDNQSLQNELFEIFPNPAFDVITIQNNSSESIAYNIVNPDGKIVIHQFLEGNSSVRIDVTVFPKGIYIVGFKGNATFARKLIIR
jgi:hypothetical protein